MAHPKRSHFNNSQSLTIINPSKSWQPARHSCMRPTLLATWRGVNCPSASWGRSQWLTPLIWEGRRQILRIEWQMWCDLEKPEQGFFPNPMKAKSKCLHWRHRAINLAAGAAALPLEAMALAGLSQLIEADSYDSYSWSTVHASKSGRCWNVQPTALWKPTTVAWVSWARCENQTMDSMDSDFGECSWQVHAAQGVPSRSCHALCRCGWDGLQDEAFPSDYGAGREFPPKVS